MTMQTFKEYISILRVRYQKTQSKVEKGQIIDECLQNTSITNRKSAIRALNRPEYKHRKNNSGAKEKYAYELVKPLKIIWQASHFAGSKNLKPVISDILDNLKRFNEISISL